MWKSVKIGETCLVTDYVANGSFKSLRENVRYIDEGGYAILVRLTDFTKGWNGNYKFISKDSYQFLRKSSLQEGDLIVSNVGEPGKTFLVPDLGMPMSLAPNSILVRPNKSEISTSFLKYYLDSTRGQKLIKSIESGTTQRKFNKTSFRELNIDIPSLAEQQHIVSKLDAAFARIDDAIEAVNSKVIEVENLKASLLNDLTSKNIVKLQNVCEIYNGGTPKSNNKSYWDGEIQWLTPKDMGKLSGRYVTNTSRKITIDGLNNSSAKLIPSQSVILSCRAPIGHVFINEVEMSFNQGCKGLVPKNDITVEYLYYFLFSSKKLLNDLGTGTTFKEISGKVLANVPIPLPSILEQKSIVAKLDTAFSKLEIAKNAIIKSKISYQKLKSTILKQELQSKVA